LRSQDSKTSQFLALNTCVAQLHFELACIESYSILKAVNTYHVHRFLEICVEHIHVEDQRLEQDDQQLNEHQQQLEQQECRF
jgi:hypothetical protein